MPDEPTDPHPLPAGDADLEPYLELAREIHREVARVVEDDHADADSLTAAIARVPERERARVAREVFDRLDAEVQWAVLEQAFGDAEIRDYLADEHRRRTDALARSGARLGLAQDARAEQRLDTSTIPANERVVVGLFREREARAAVTKGHLADTCARQLVLQCVRPGEFRVIEDVFNPRGGLFTTGDYDERTWQAERLAPHAVVRLGAATPSEDGLALEPVLYPAGRCDVATEAAVIPGHLHVGFVMLGDIDVFAG